MLVVLQRHWHGLRKGCELDTDPTQAGLLVRDGIATLKQQSAPPVHKMVEQPPQAKTSSPPAAGAPPHRHNGSGPGAVASVPTGARPRPETQINPNPGRPWKGKRK